MPITPVGLAKKGHRLFCLILPQWNPGLLQQLGLFFLSRQGFRRLVDEPQLLGFQCLCHRRLSSHNDWCVTAAVQELHLLSFCDVLFVLLTCASMVRLSTLRALLL